MGEVVRKVTEMTGNKAVLVTDVGQNQMMAARYFKFLFINLHQQSLAVQLAFGIISLRLNQTNTFGIPFCYTQSLALQTILVRIR